MRSRRTTSCYLLIIAALLLTIPVAEAHDPRARTPMNFPDILGYKTLKCDFHIHTVFSDGAVWPDVRPEEAWREGLDAIAITDHIEYQPHKDDLPTAHNRSFEIAKPQGDTLMITVIHGSEITRDMPPGHLNAIFINDSVALDREDWHDAFAEAKRQGAFIFWNHPGWDGQQPDGVARWYSEHTELLEQGLLHGIEVANERSYYPEAHRWCLEKNLTMLSNSDVHAPVNLDYHVHHGDHRPVTLVFAKDSSAEAIREALFDRRTAVYSANLLIGLEKYVRPLFENSVKVLNPAVEITGKGSAYIQIQNSSDLDYELKEGQSSDLLAIDAEVTLQAGKTVLVRLRGKKENHDAKESVSLQYVAENVKVAPDQGLSIEIPITVDFHPKPQTQGK